MQANSDTPQKTTRTREEYSTRIFLFALELIPYFGIPALIGYFINDWLQQSYPGLGLAGTVGVFVTTYIFSWIVVIARYRSITRNLKQ